MDKQSRIRRSIKVMKVFMLLIIAIPFLQYQQTGSFSLQDILATLACLCWMQALFKKGSQHKTGCRIYSRIPL
ncbi:hypothetical protein [Neptunicella marina]|uniref:Uncharacterized protein n=1 Tax=Neptunicella marina TaxID=2125989 RepID=A0A8J6IS72_9ALTE|nr:hypothetical protein [Neptunicella marina]MBC3765424.1 hypothetical protein [Neptunicella marina]